jgi:hypothetical protein
VGAAAAKAGVTTDRIIAEMADARSYRLAANGKVKARIAELVGAR